MPDPKILVFDIETAPIEGYVWGLYDQNIALNQIKEDWSILSWGAKWYGEPASKAMYMDNSLAKNVRDDKKLVLGLWKLLDEADIVITQNGDKFDIRKFNARAIIHGLPPVSSFKSTDVMKECKKVFGFTSQSLEYTSKILNTRYKKLMHNKYPGMELWKEVLKGNKDAWREMRTYCIHDVLSTEEKFQKVQGWIKTQNMSCYFDDAVVRCFCGSKNVIKKGFVYTDSGKFQGYKCTDCGKRPKGRINLFRQDKKKSLLKHGGR
jgi:DNA polymerase elongation subunit (family B)